MYRNNDIYTLLIICRFLNVNMLIVSCKKMKPRNQVQMKVTWGVLIWAGLGLGLRVVLSNDETFKDLHVASTRC